jgi:hypothetical protein
MRPITICAIVAVIFFIGGYFVSSKYLNKPIPPKTVVKIDTVNIHHSWTDTVLVYSEPKIIHDTMWIDSTTKFKTYVKTFEDSIATLEVSSVVDGELKEQRVKSTYHLKEYHSVDSVFINKTTTITTVPYGLYLGVNSTSAVGVTFVRGRWNADIGYAVVKDQFGNRLQAGLKYKIW